MAQAAAIAQLHKLCAVYTQRPVAEKMLDAIDWTATADPRGRKLLEPCVGDGALLLAAVERLLAARRLFGLPSREADLVPHIESFEISPRVASSTRRAVEKAMARSGVGARVAKAVAHQWVARKDFLLGEVSPVTHVVANPPYVRWNNVPPLLASRYLAHIGAERAQGDLSIAFLHGIADRLAPEGKAAILCTDRWIYSRAGAGLRRRFDGEFRISRGEAIDAKSAFQSEVLAYPIIMLMERSRRRAHSFEVLGAGTEGLGRSQALRDLKRLQKRFGTIEAAACTVRVGPALGCERAFIFGKSEAQVEEDLLRPYVKPPELVGSRIEWKGRKVVRLNTSKGGWIDLGDYPKLAQHLEAYRESLKRRTCVTKPELWYRTIDAISDTWTKEAKLLLPELSTVPRVCLDSQGLVPSHGIYAILSASWPLEALAGILSGGLLDLVAKAVAPILRGGSFRLYGRFLREIPLPKWQDLDPEIQSALRSPSTRSATVNELLGLRRPSKK